MTPPFDPARAADIIAAYGADPARWPDAERAGVAAALAGDAALRTRRDEAAGLDTLLGDWATAPLADAASVPPPLVTQARRWPTWLVGGGLAAAAVAAMIVLQPGDATAPVTQTAQQVAPTTTTTAPIGEAPTYAMLFTLTPDEESLI